MKKFSYLVIALLLSSVSAAQAATVTLSSLLNGGSLMVGDKRFDNFQYIATGTAPAPSQINVTPFVNGTDVGLSFQLPMFSVGGTVDAELDFKVTVLDPNFQIVGVTLEGNPSVIGGSGAMTVTETFLPEHSTDILEIYNLSPGSFLGLDSVTFDNGVRSLNVQKDIMAVGNTGAAIISIIRQTFHQAPVPEPASFLSIGFGLVGFLATRRHRHEFA